MTHHSRLACMSIRRQFASITCGRLQENLCCCSKVPSHVLWSGQLPRNCLILRCRRGPPWRKSHNLTSNPCSLISSFCMFFCLIISRFLDPATGLPAPVRHVFPAASPAREAAKDAPGEHSSTFVFFPVGRIFTMTSA